MEMEPRLRLEMGLRGLGLNDQLEHGNDATARLWLYRNTISGTGRKLLSLPTLRNGALPGTHEAQS